MRSTTTVRISAETRNRIRALGGDTYEETIIDRLAARAADVDAAFDGIA